MGMISSMGAGKAAEQQAKAMKEIAKGYGTLTKRQYEEYSPYMNAGKGALTAQMQMLANPINNQAAMSTYYASPEYAMQQDAANYAAMSGASAAGTTGNTATSNALATQATQLGQNYLASLDKARQQQINTLGDISKQGLSATNAMAGHAGKNYNSAASYLGSAAGLEGQADMAPYSGIQSSLYRMPWYFGMAKAGGTFGF